MPCLSYVATTVMNAKCTSRVLAVSVLLFQAECFYFEVYLLIVSLLFSSQLTFNIVTAVFSWVETHSGQWKGCPEVSSCCINPNLFEWTMQCRQATWKIKDKRWTTFLYQFRGNLNSVGLTVMHPPVSTHDLAKAYFVGAPVSDLQWKWKSSVYW